MLGIDLYQQYNLVTDWHLVAGAGVRDVYIKLTDGGGRAQVLGDVYVAGARGVGCQVGGYHYLQPTPSPEAQADVFAAELTRLRALDIAPALDLEEASIPAGVRVEFGRRFLLRLQANLGVSTVALYSSASWMAGLHPETWGIPGLVNWTAHYGPNDGAPHPVSLYTGHIDVHQYTSAGRIPGIAGPVDLDDVTGDIAVTTGTTATPKRGDDDIMITAPAGTNEHVNLIVPATGNLYFATSYGDTLTVHQLDYYGPTDPTKLAAGNGVGGGRGEFVVHPNDPGPASTIPAGAIMCTVRYDASHSFGVGVR